MSAPTNRTAYKPYYERLDQALETKNGIRIRCDDEGEAKQLQIRLHTARKYDRDLNRLSRDPSDPAFGTSDYDPLVVSVKEGVDCWWVYINNPIALAYVEEIPDEPDESSRVHSNEVAEQPTVRVSNLRRPVRP
jgi:hypothetical protein